MTKNERAYRRLNSELGLEFDLYVLEHPDWFEKNIPNGATVVIQTDDPGFNAWARGMAEKNRGTRDEEGPLVLVSIHQLRPQRSRIKRMEAKVLAPVRRKKERAYGHHHR